MILSLFIITVLFCFSATSFAGPPDASLPGPSADTMTDILDIQPLADPVGWSSLMIWGVAALVGACVGGVLLYLFFRRKNKDSILPEIIVLPWERAQTALDMLSMRSEELSDRPYYFELSRILRQYLNDRFSFHALEMTAEELVPALKSHDVPAVIRTQLTALIQQADMVKFAREEKTDDERAADFDLVQQMVLLSTPEVAEEGI